MSRHANAPKRRGAGQSGFRQWRRTRPFWGGFLVILGGLVILAAPLAPLPLIIQQGIAGISGYFVGLLLLAIGVLAWLQPAQRMFFGIVAMLLSLASFVTSNFGGFVIGMLLGIVGGALIFAWLPNRPERRRGRDRRGAPPEGDIEPTDDPDDTVVDSGAPAGDAEEPDDQREDRDRGDPPGSGVGPAGSGGPGWSAGGDRLRAFAALPLAAALFLPGAAAPTDWPWDWLGPDDEESSQPSPSPSPSPSLEPSIPVPGDGGSDDGDKDSEEGKDDKEDDGDQDGDESGDATKCEYRQGSSSVARSEEEFLKAVQNCKAAREKGESPEVRSQQAQDGRFPAHTITTSLTADKLTMSGARFDGVVEYPTAKGSRRYLKMSMDKAEFEGALHSFEHGSSTGQIDLPTATMSGDVVMHVTRMEARILGIKLTFTPDFPPPLLLPHMTVTDLEVDQPLAQANTISIPELGETATS